MSRCTLKGCPYDRDGRCIENQLPDCPNLLQDEAKGLEVSDETKPAIIEPAPPPPTHESFYLGRKLTAEEARPIFQSRPVQVIVLGGMVESGKTTLLARIFEMFQCGGLTGYRFAHSRTLVEFDNMSWHAMMESGGTAPATEHTSRSENNLFLHLRVRGENGAAPPIDLLIGDIPGEIFPEAVAEISVCRSLSALGRANHLLLFLDCEVLNREADRHDHYGKVFDFVVRALETRQIGQHTVLHLIFSKCDKLPADVTEDRDRETLKYVADTEKQFRTAFTSRVGGLCSWRLAARPEPPYEPTLVEINKVFHSWMNRATPHSGNLMQPSKRTNFQRDFCRFGLS